MQQRYSFLFFLQTGNSKLIKREKAYLPIFFCQDGSTNYPIIVLSFEKMEVSLEDL